MVRVEEGVIHGAGMRAWVKRGGQQLEVRLILLQGKQLEEWWWLPAASASKGPAMAINVQWPPMG